MVNLGGRVDNDLIWPQVHVSSDGKYDLVFHCRASAACGFDVQVDGRNVAEVPFQETNGAFLARPVRCALKKGTHSARISNSASALPDVDRMEISLGEGP